MFNLAVLFRLVFLIAGYYLDGSRIEVSWAKPADKTEALRRSALEQGGLLNLFRNFPADAFSCNQLPLQLQPQLCPQQMTCNSFSSSANELRTSGITEIDRLNLLKNSMPQNTNDRNIHESHSLSRILRNPMDINLIRQPTSTNLPILQSEQTVLSQQLNEYFQHQK